VKTEIAIFYRHSVKCLFQAAARKGRLNFK